MQKYKVIFLLYLVMSTQALSCPEGPDCLNAGTHRLHKRDIEEVHTINILEAKEKLMEAYQEIKPLLKEFAADIAPSIQEKFTQTYLPALQSFRDEVMPFFYAKIYPQVQKYFKFGLHIAEKLVDKTYRAYKLSNSTHIAVISVSDLIDETYNELRPLLEMGRYLSARMMVNKGQSRGRRYVPQGSSAGNSIEEIHVIDVQKVKLSLIKAYQAITPLLEQLLSEVSPSIYEEFDLSYFPKIREIVSVVSPFFQSKYYAQVQKYITFASRVTEKLVDRAYRSYQLSNSTHINIVSIIDVIEEIYTEFKPVLDLAKYLSTRMSMSSKHYRGKRDVSEPEVIRRKRQVPDFLMSMVTESLTSLFRGNEDSLLSKVCLPLIYDIMADPESKYDLLTAFLTIKSAFAPLVWEMLQRQAFNTPEGTVIRIPRSRYEKAMADFQVARPAVDRLVRKYTPKFMYYMDQATPQVVDMFDALFYEGYTGVNTLKDQYLEFVYKHRSLFRSSSSSDVYYYPINEIMNDLAPIKISAINVLVQYMRRNPNSWVNVLFGENALIQRLYVGTPVYAKPAPTSAPTKKYGTPKYRYIKSG